GRSPASFCALCVLCGEISSHPWLIPSARSGYSSGVMDDPLAREAGMGRRSVDVVWVLLCGVLSSVWCLTAARDLGVTFDEPIYIEKGLERWREGPLSPLIRLGTMPLPVDVQTFPIHIWERFRGTPFDARADLATILPVARAANLVFWWVL